MIFSKKTDNKYRKVYNQNYSLIFSILYKKTANVEDAEEICQEVFLTYYKNHLDIEKPRQWLIKASNYEYLKFMRNNNKKNNIDNIDNEYLEELYSDDKEDLDTKIIIQDVVYSEKNFKTKDDKKLFELISKTKFTYQKTADILGLSERQVRYKYKRTLYSLFNDFRNMGIKSIADLI